MWTFNRALYKRKKYITSKYRVQHFSVPKKLLKIFPRISNEITKLVNSFGAIKETEKTLRQLKFKTSKGTCLK